MNRLSAVLVLALAASAAAEDRLAVSAGAPCNSARVNFAGTGGRAGCGAGAGLRYLHLGDGVFDAGLDFSYMAFDRSKVLDGKAGRVSVGQFLLQVEPHQGDLRPYLQLGAGLHHASRHSTEHPLDLAASGAVGVEVLGERLFGAFEARATYLTLDTSRFPVAQAVVYTPSVLMGVRFR